MSTDTIVARIIVRGRVQGVGYRAWTQDEALARGLAGWVRNRRDGSVEAEFSGEADCVEEMIETCRRGPPGSRVERIERAAANHETFTQPGGRFSVLPTV